MTEAAAPSPGRIFISYRREETAFSAGWLYDRLADRYGDGQVFKDVDSIELGDDFVDVITAAVGSCDVLLALVGDQWLTITDSHGRRRLDDPDDFVRVEIEAALTRNVRVIPILVDGAMMPRADELPPSLARLVRRHALELSPARFEYDTGRLWTVLDRTLAEVRTAHDDAAAVSAPAQKAVDPSTEPPKAPERTQGQEEMVEERARHQAAREARDPRFAPAGPFLQAEPDGERLSTVTGAVQADADTAVPTGKVEGVDGAAADHVGLGSASGGPRPAARRRRWVWGVVALVSVMAAALVVVGQISGSGSDVLLASFETGTEGWQPNRDTPDAGRTSQASDFATDGSFSLRIDNANADGAWYGIEYGEVDEPIDITGTSAVSVDMKGLDEDAETAIAVQLGDEWAWCESPDWGLAKAGTDWLTVTLDVDLGTMNCPEDEPASSDLAELQAVWVWIDGTGSFLIDNVRAE